MNEAEPDRSARKSIFRMRALSDEQVASMEKVALRAHRIAARARVAAKITQLQQEERRRRLEESDERMQGYREELRRANLL